MCAPVDHAERARESHDDMNNCSNDIEEHLKTIRLFRSHPRAGSAPPPPQHAPPPPQHAPPPPQHAPPPPQHAPPPPQQAPSICAPVVHTEVQALSNHQITMAFCAPGMSKLAFCHESICFLEVVELHIHRKSTQENNKHRCNKSSLPHHEHFADKARCICCTRGLHEPRIPEGHLVKPIFCRVRWTRLRTSRLVTRRVAAFSTAIDELALHASVCFAGLSALVASHLDLVLGATPCPHLIESVFRCMLGIWPWLGAARCITWRITTSLAAIDELCSSTFPRSARNLASMTGQVPSAIVASVSLESIVSALVLARLATTNARWIAMCEAIILTIHERVVRHSKLWPIFCIAEDAWRIPAIEAHPAKLVWPSGAVF